jgi:hypothetical protein
VTVASNIEKKGVKLTFSLGKLSFSLLTKEFNLFYQLHGVAKFNESPKNKFLIKKGTIYKYNSTYFLFVKLDFFYQNSLHPVITLCLFQLNSHPKGRKKSQPK